MRKLTLGILFALFSLGFAAPALADGSTICTPLWNATSGAKSCVEVGQTGPSGPTNPLPVAGSYSYSNITTDATTTVKATAGLLHTICVNSPAATETVQIYDSLTATGTKIGLITEFASTNGCFTYDVRFSTGLTIVTGVAAGDLTVSYQ